jgi:cytochrome c
MHIYSKKRLAVIIGGCLTTLALSSKAVYAANPCGAKNPCAAKHSSQKRNPCNPCAAKNPCGAKNPCAAKGVTRPANYKPYRASKAGLVAAGEKLFTDTSLSSNGMSCATCHNHYGAYQSTYAEPYPHYVRMAKDQFKVKAVHADEMVQLCMLTPMAAKPLPWDSKELAALTAYVVDQQPGFAHHLKTAGMNPCAARNPCGAKNPCAAKNPCSAR